MVRPPSIASVALRNGIAQQLIASYVMQVHGVAKMKYICNIISEKIVAERRSAQDQHGHGEDTRS